MDTAHARARRTHGYCKPHLVFRTILRPLRSTVQFPLVMLFSRRGTASAQTSKTTSSRDFHRGISPGAGDRLWPGERRPLVCGVSRRHQPSGNGAGRSLSRAPERGRRCQVLRLSTGRGEGSARRWLLRRDGRVSGRPLAHDVPLQLGLRNGFGLRDRRIAGGRMLRQVRTQQPGIAQVSVCRDGSSSGRSCSICTIDSPRSSDREERDHGR